ncbi:MAG: tRNA pseudouridine synthase A [Caldanaerobacter subterraneus]|uniref:tRNA pseudouridine synthase A n=3 Tax=Thermoanaerobacter TaxID=1754 RepID=TRUA_THEP3|nr:MULTISPECIES: tRNA pseudouridine(38-40) synthase TruA [Thermoanaerobacter]B0K5S6.1 RecName: Full=tRNA pseudouridine synthase A; AltName: Full=tRNA pseudouridine(38-40) synthase; AltName: Full=tRNA pseudouridylate synthase I; AltName: Full=tRNA-uridine isomerase I [Thermoanaerobacter sp. X514]B0KCN3.1 RecName: Full=tRNA pseudouridine synthase A; AltName: Full=tRNA pseudouridine(38-40) synthase; AltName: Full=tRNA pseudouridylate synthase I; AltName: Full=tRNA-uridine isomerase I [Thermoanaeroba
MRNVMIVVEYDGTNYHGWQYQKNAVTVQEVLQKAIKKVTGEEVNLIGASRTDTGVHALYQVANFKTNTKIPAEKLPYALNSVLPDDIVVVQAKDVEDSFHARYSAKRKRYKYIILNRKFQMPTMRNYCWHISYPLNIEEMKKAASYLIGTHDFSAFKASGSSKTSTIRTVYDLTIEKNEDFINIEIEANGFLYNMVRIIVGTLSYVGLGKIKEDEVYDILKSKDRTKAGITAPPQGLYLIKIIY